MQLGLKNSFFFVFLVVDFCCAQDIPVKYKHLFYKYFVRWTVGQATKAIIVYLQKREL